jgi:hypothetical protein
MYKRVHTIRGSQRDVVYLGGPKAPERSKKRRGREGLGLVLSAGEHTVIVLEREDLGASLLVCPDKMFSQEN